MLTLLQKLLQLGTLAVGGYRNDATAGARQGTSDRQELKRIQRAGQERDTSVHLPYYLDIRSTSTISPPLFWAQSLT